MTHAIYSTVIHRFLFFVLFITLRLGFRQIETNAVYRVCIIGARICVSISMSKANKLLRISLSAFNWDDRSRWLWIGWLWYVFRKTVIAPAFERQKFTFLHLLIVLINLKNSLLFFGFWKSENYADGTDFGWFSSRLTAFFLVFCFVLFQMCGRSY